MMFKHLKIFIIIIISWRLKTTSGVSTHPHTPRHAPHVQHTAYTRRRVPMLDARIYFLFTLHVASFCSQNCLPSSLVFVTPVHSAHRARVCILLTAHSLCIRYTNDAHVTGYENENTKHFLQPHIGWQCALYLVPRTFASYLCPGYTRADQL